ncbi:Phosphate-selective porin [Lutibacter oricola]|uniref:Phosphate-selective porin n=1 Tax=Lutibacter oricola TaxID=762486 RepID=A0A1H3CF46_9FLAO|nr:porin [Lutibacter oricola]SDX52753.1 Phosphate-selective porin [Lutibacter oricola]
MKTKILLIVVVLLAVNFSFAQGCEDDIAPTGTKSGVPTTSSITFFGYIQGQYSSEFLQPETTSSFHFKRARFGVRGRINRSFSYYASLEASDFVSSDGNPYLLDAFITWDKHEWAKISMGSFKQPFSRDVATACHSLTTIDRSIVADQLVAPQRDYGLMLLGGSSKTKFRYSLALMNGTGLGTKDTNKKKDVIGRATYQLLNFLNVGASFRYGYPTNEDDDRTSYGFDALISYKKLSVQGEYIYDEGAYNLGADGGCGATPVILGDKRQGAYVMAAYKVSDKLQPVLKYEYFDADTDLKVSPISGYQEMFTVGVNYFFHKKVRLQVNYQIKEVDNNSDHDALLAQVQVRF